MTAVQGVLSRVREVLNRWPAVGLAVGVVRDGSLEFFHGHGVADIASSTPITEDTVFRIASITKTFTAVAVMQLHERGLVDLDAPANDYLRAYRLRPARPGFRHATVRHLLTHTAGVPQVVHPTRMLSSRWFGESVPIGQPVPPLADYYGGELRLAVEPGTTFTYSDHGFATLGQLVEDVTGQPLAHYFSERIFRPLGMADTGLARPDSAGAHLATGYTLGRHGAEAVTDRVWLTTGASSIYSTPRDMGRYLAALTCGGAAQHGRVLEPATLATMFEPHFQPDPRIPGFGLGLFRMPIGGHLAVEHQGVLPGFTSQIFLAPDDGIAVLAFTNGSRQALTWLPAECGRLLRELLQVRDDPIRTDLAQRPDTWAGLCGWYRARAQPTDLQAWSFFGLGAEVLVRGGRLIVRPLSPIPALYRGFPLHPDDAEDPSVFRVDLSRFGIGTARVVFGREPATGERALHLDLIPISLHKRPAATNPRRWAAGALGVAATAVVAGRRRSPTPRP